MIDPDTTSPFTREQAIEIIATYASKALRWCETDSPHAMGGPLPSEIDVVIRIPGSFGSAEDFFEALRVLGGHIRPAPTSNTPPLNPDERAKAISILKGAWGVCMNENRLELAGDISDLVDQLSVPTPKYRHVKSGRLYEKLGEVMNATTGHPGEVLIRYRAVDSSDIEFVRKVEEFAERFTEVSSGEQSHGG